MLTHEIYQNQPCVRLRLSNSNDTVLIALQGAQVLSWQSSDGCERLFLSPRAVFDGHTAIRGGVPICFPQFNQRGPLPKHGFARNLPWHVLTQTSTKNSSSITLRLSQSPATLALWPHSFNFDLTITLAQDALEISAEVFNTGAQAFDFAVALHSYLKVDKITETHLAGLNSAAKWDAVRDVRSTEIQQCLSFDGEFDTVFDVSKLDNIKLQLTQAQPAKQLEIMRSASMSECVVWNPGAALCATLHDMRPDSYRTMLCVEAAKIDVPVRLDAGQRWQGSQRLCVAD